MAKVTDRVIDNDPKFFNTALVIVVVSLFVAVQFVVPSGFYKGLYLKDKKNNAEQPIIGCVATGCSSQVCAEEEVITTCEYKEEYACYKTARCERQTNGDCGWTMTPELSECIAAKE